MPTPPASSLITALSLAVQLNHPADFEGQVTDKETEVHWRSALRVKANPSFPAWYYNSRGTKRTPTPPITKASPPFSSSVSEILLETHSADLQCFLIFKSPTKIQKLLGQVGRKIMLWEPVLQRVFIYQVIMRSRVVTHKGVWGNLKIPPSQKHPKANQRKTLK